MRLFSVGLAVIVTLIGVGAPETVFAQQDTAAGPRFRKAFASLSEGHTVKVLRASGTTVGQYNGIIGDSLSLRAGDGPPTTLALDEVQAAWSRKHNAGKGALIGGIVGVVLGGALGAVAASLCESSDCNDAGFAIGSALLGGAVSAGVGALIGAAIPGWKRIGPHD